MSQPAKVRDYPDLIKRNGGVVNINQAEYARAKQRHQHTHRLEKLETKVCSMESKLGDILELLKKLSN